MGSLGLFDILKYLVILVMSAAIGVVTNYIAVKMLFRPYREKRIGRFRIPFTPGIMPRRQAALAHALGEMVSNSLVRTEDLKNALLSDEISKTVARGILAFPSIRVSGENCFGDGYYEKKDAVLDLLTDKIIAGVRAMDVGAVITNEATAAVAGFAAHNPLVGMFVNDAMIAQLAAPIGDKVTGFLDGEGREKLRAALEEELAQYEDLPVAQLVKDTAAFERALIDLYRRLVTRYADSIASQFHIADIVEKKIKAMPPESLETLVLSVMKKELNAVVWLGGAIGLLLGVLSVVLNLVF